MTIQLQLINIIIIIISSSSSSSSSIYKTAVFKYKLQTCAALLIAHVCVLWTGSMPVNDTIFLLYALRNWHVYSRIHFPTNDEMQRVPKCSLKNPTLTLRKKNKKRRNYTKTYN